MIIEDLGPNNDLELAYNLFSEAATHNESRALNGLGKMHLKGLFVPKDVKKALQNFKSKNL
jgi:TPR repeat protein